MTNRARLACSCLLVGTLVPAQQPAVAIDSGALLCFTTIDESSGHRENVLHVAAVRGTAAAREIWRGTGTTHVVRRLDRDAVLVANFETPRGFVVIDLATGAKRELGGSPHDFVGVHGDEVLFLGSLRDDEPGLVAAPWRGSGQRRRLADAPFDRVPIVQGNLAIAITTPGREIHAVSLVRGEARKVCTLAATPTAPCLALSPGGELLAIGLVQPDGAGTLSIVDVGSGRSLRSWMNLPVRLPPESSDSPRLEVGFDDDTHVVCSETRSDAQGMRGNFVFVQRDIHTGEVTRETVYSGLALQHSAPPRPGAPPSPPPRFEIESDRTTSKLRRAGSPQMLAEISRERQQYQDLWISPDGTCATARLGDKRDRLVLFAVDATEPRELAKAWAYDVCLLPAAQ